MLLRHEGLPKDEITKKLRTMTPADKDVLWGRVRKSRAAETVPGPSGENSRPASAGWLAIR